MTYEKSAEVIDRLDIRNHTFSNSVTSAVTTEWGVNWNEEQISRDILQKFYDANRGRLSEVDISIEGSTCIVTAPTPFDLQRLYYFGSEKTESDIGQYGEGFKAASICLLRDHRVRPVVQSGNQLVSMRIGDEPAVEGSILYPMIYDYSSTGDAIEGARLFLLDCPAKLLESLSRGFNIFSPKRTSLWDRFCGVQRMASSRSMSPRRHKATSSAEISSAA
jgi:hypothetical protein